MGSDTTTLIIKAKINSNNVIKSVWFVIFCQAHTNFENWDFFLWYISSRNEPLRYTKNRGVAIRIAKNIDKNLQSIYGIVRNNLHSSKVIPTDETGKFIPVPHPY